MSRIETEARELLLQRRESLCRAPPEAVLADPTAGWHDWESQSHAELARRELDEIEAALRRIDQGSYGSCEACGGPMGMQRIRAIPEARFCLSCSGQHEEVD
jgi:DnaK suppressor protein